ncbi:hypothetical protein KIW84_010408 [Lathyrus oleraceus]|uniref:Uncharacterized protein n=1 Tax=Pisum sativum TaxID=3888 RepID=A0A9D4YJS6_PEA|nr:hypothetical protein KIW84_010408 [Pisum sativum]
MLFQISCNFIVGDSFVVLCRDKDSVDTDWNHGTLIIVILNSDLCFPIRSQPRACPVLANLGELGAQLGRKNVAKRHKLRGFVGGVTEHVTLITSTNFLRPFCEMAMDTLSNIRTLLLNIDKDFAVVSIKTNII